MLPDIDLTERFELRGVWWLPNEPDRTFHGTLKFDPDDGLQLDVAGDFGPMHKGQVEYPIVLGNAGRRVTLMNCTVVGQTGGLLNVTNTDLNIDVAYFGVHHADHDELRFTEFGVRFSLLDDWIRWPRFDTEFKSPYGGDLTMRLLNHDPLKVTVGQYEYSMSLTWSYSHTVSQYRIDTHAWTQVKSTIPLKLDEFRPILRHLQNFYSLMLGQATSPKMLYGFADGPVDETDDDHPNLPIQIADLRYSALRLQVPKAHKFLVSEQQVHDSFGEYLTNWFEKKDQLKPALDLFFAVMYNDALYLEGRFLSLVQAVEAYHRRVFGGTYQNEVDYHNGLYKRLVDALPSDLDKDFRQSLTQGTLQYAYQYSLRKRLKELSKWIAEHIDGTILSRKQTRNVLCDRLAGVRNSLTHYDPQSQDEVLPAQELFDLTEKLEAILVLCLLLEAGLDDHTIGSAMRSHWRYRVLFGNRDSA